MTGRVVCEYFLVTFQRYDGSTDTREIGVQPSISFDEFLTAVRQKFGHDISFLLDNDGFRAAGFPTCCSGAD